MADETLLEEATLTQQPAVPRKDPKEKQKLAAGLLLLVVGVFLLIKRFPKTDYVEVVADKPRPGAQAAAPVPLSPAPAPRPQPPAAAQTASASKAQQPAMAGPNGKPAAPIAKVRTGPPPLSEWEEPCAAEIGILCYKVPTRQLRKCLRRYEEALRQSCSNAFFGKEE